MNEAFTDVLALITFFLIFGILLYALGRFIDNVIFKQCPHGIQFGKKGKCEKCSENRNVMVPVKSHHDGHCKACGDIISSRLKQQEITNEERKYNIDELNVFLEKGHYHPLFKDQFHLRHYPPVEYYPNFCDKCFVEEQRHNYSNIYKFKKWRESFSAPFLLLFWVVLLALLWGKLTSPTIFLYIGAGYIIVVILYRYLLGVSIVTPKSQARQELNTLIRAHENIIRAQEYMLQMDEEEKAARERIRLKQTSRIDEIDKMSGVQFEDRLAEFFRSCGYSVKKTSVSGDHGADLVIEKSGTRIAIQAKRYSRNNSVGNAAIQEVIAGKIMYDCTQSWVITTSYFTKAAVELADKAQVRLTNRDELIQLLGKKEVV